MQQPFNFITILSALSAAIGFAAAGIVALPIDDAPKAIAAFALGVVGTFVSGLLKPPAGPQVAANPDPSPPREQRTRLRGPR